MAYGWKQMSETNGKVKTENGNLTYPLRFARPPNLVGQSVTTEYPKLSPWDRRAKRVFRRMTECHSVPSEGRTLQCDVRTTPAGGRGWIKHDAIELGITNSSKYWVLSTEYTSRRYHFFQPLMLLGTSEVGFFCYIFRAKSKCLCWKWGFCIVDVAIGIKKRK
jgi:hypothetical protein